MRGPSFWAEGPSYFPQQYGISGVYAQPQPQSPGSQNQGAQATSQATACGRLPVASPGKRTRGNGSSQGMPDDYQVTVTTSDSRYPQAVAPAPPSVVQRSTGTSAEKTSETTVGACSGSALFGDGHPGDCSFAGESRTESRYVRGALNRATRAHPVVKSFWSTLVVTCR